MEQICSNQMIAYAKVFNVSPVRKRLEFLIRMLHFRDPLKNTLTIYALPRVPEGKLTVNALQVNENEQKGLQRRFDQCTIYTAAVHTTNQAITSRISLLFVVVISAALPWMIAVIVL